MANKSTSIYDEAKNYVYSIIQQDIPWVDADENDREEIHFNNLRRLIQRALGDGAVGDAFKVTGTGASNDFTLEGGDGTADNQTILFEDGLMARLIGDKTFNDATNSAIKAKSSALTETVLTDDSANYKASELVGRTLIPDIASSSVSATITANTSTTITCSGATFITSGAVTKKNYLVQLSTPSGSRTDSVYLNLYLDEADEVEDSNLTHNIGSNVVAQLRKKLRMVVHVMETDSGSGGLADGDYTDSASRKHYVRKIATFARTATANINSGMVTDNRVKLILQGDKSAVAVTKAGVAVGTQPTLNFIEGSNVTLTIADDTTNEEIDITIASSGGGGTMTFTVAGDTGSSQTIADTNTLTVAGGGGIDTVASATDTITIAIDDSVAQQVAVTASGGTASGDATVSIDNHTTANTLGLVAGSNVTLTGTNSAGTIKIEAASSTGMTSFTLAGTSGANQTITDGNTLTVAAGNSMGTTGSSTDTVTITHKEPFFLPAPYPGGWDGDTGSLSENLNVTITNEAIGTGSTPSSSNKMRAYYKVVNTSAIAAGYFYATFRLPDSFQSWKSSGTVSLHYKTSATGATGAFNLYTQDSSIAIATATPAGTSGSWSTLAIGSADISGTQNPGDILVVKVAGVFTSTSKEVDFGEIVFDFNT